MCVVTKTTKQPIKYQTKPEHGQSPHLARRGRCSPLVNCSPSSLVVVHFLPCVLWSLAGYCICLAVCSLGLVHCTEFKWTPWCTVTTLVLITLFTTLSGPCWMHLVALLGVLWMLVSCSTTATAASLLFILCSCSLTSLGYSKFAVVVIIKNGNGN